MLTKIRNIGNSKGAVIPVQILQQLALKEGDSLNINATHGRIVIEPVRQKKHYQLDDLLAQCDETAPMPEVLSEWDSVTSVGNEDGCF